MKPSGMVSYCPMDSGLSPMTRGSSKTHQSATNSPLFLVMPAKCVGEQVVSCASSEGTWGGRLYQQCDSRTNLLQTAMREAGVSLCQNP